MCTEADPSGSDRPGIGEGAVGTPGTGSPAQDALPCSDVQLFQGNLTGVTERGCRERGCVKPDTGEQEDKLPVWGDIWLTVSSHGKRLHCSKDLWTVSADPSSTTSTCILTLGCQFYRLELRISVCVGWLLRWPQRQAAVSLFCCS